MWQICQGKGQSLYWRVKIKRVVLLSETLHKKASILCLYLQKYLILKSNTIISSKMLKAFTCQKNTAVLPFLNWLSIIPIMLAVWLAGWNVHLVSKYLFLISEADKEFPPICLTNFSQFDALKKKRNLLLVPSIFLSVMSLTSHF